MVSRQRLLLILGAERREFDGFSERAEVRGGVDWCATTRLSGGDAVLAANGPGRDRARAAVEILCGRFEISAVVSTGFAGALDPSMRLGDIFLADQVRQGLEGLEYPGILPRYAETFTPHRGRLTTIDRVAQTAAEKRRLREAGFDAVEMEAAAVAAAAKERGLPFYCIRTISDLADQDFPIDFNRARRAEGAFSPWRVVAQAGLSPAKWRALFRLRDDARLAARNLADFLSQCEFPAAEGAVR